MCFGKYVLLLLLAVEFVYVLAPQPCCISGTPAAQAVVDWASSHSFPASEWIGCVWVRVGSEYNVLYVMLYIYVFAFNGLSGCVCVCVVCGPITNV